MLLDLYPVSIRRPVIEGFEGSLAVAESSGRGAEPRAPRLSTELSKQADTTAQKPVAAKAKAKEASDLLNVLEKASGSGEGLPDQVRPPGPAEMAPNEMANLSPEQRREVIRQKFLEAIQRAAEQRR